MKFSLSDCPTFLAGDHTILKELIHPKNVDLDIPFSLAWGKLEVGKSSLNHKLSQSETYYILSGKGELYINGTMFLVEKGDCVHVEAHSKQKLKNKGNTLLEFLCIVSPPWASDGEEILP